MDKRYKIVNYATRHHRVEIGENKQHKELCSRCIENVSGEGEKRVFA